MFGVKTHTLGMGIVATLLLVLVAFGVAKDSARVSAEVDTGTGSYNCHTIDKISEVPNGYASPVNLFGQSLIMKARCASDGSVTAYIGDGSNNQYIYKYGYERVNGTWKRITYSGTIQNGPWIIGSASAKLRPQTNTQTGRFISYICQRVDNRWKCGCSDTTCRTAKWQVQTYDASATSASPEEEDINEESLENESLSNSLLGDYDVLDIHYPSKYVALPGEKMTLTGSGFENKNNIDVLWNGKVGQRNLSSSNGRTIDIVVPDFTVGRYDVNVRQNGEISEYGTVIWIGTGEEPPKITSISPDTIMQGDTITIHGSGFTKNNDVITSIKEYNKVVSNDGETIDLVYDPYKKRRVLYNENAERIPYEKAVNVTIVNTSGVSNNVTFHLKYD